MRIRRLARKLGVAMATLGLALLPEMAKGQTSGDYNGLKWQLNDDGASLSIYGYDGAGGAIAIPDTITIDTNTSALPVTSIDGYAFSGASLTSVTIPDSVTNIGSWAFGGCTGLTNVTIGDGSVSGSAITTIGESAFVDCTSLASFVLGANISGTGSGPFSGFLSFRRCPLNRLNILNGVTSIGNGTFANCTGLTNVIIPDSVIRIGEDESVFAYPGGGVFEGCTSLTAITLGTGVSTIGTSAFSGCTGLIGINFPDGVNSIGEEAFEDCPSLTNIRIPNSVTNLGSWAFQGCASLTNAAIGNGVISGSTILTIGESAFSACTNLTSFILGANVVVAGGNFVVVGGNPVSVGNPPVFSGCHLNQLTILKGVTSLGDGIFTDCTNLTNVIIPNGVDSIGEEAFEGCAGLTEIIIPNSVTNVGPEAFQGCTSLTNAEIGDGVISGSTVITIGNSAFSDCTNLTTIILGSNVADMADESVFSGCPLRHLAILDGVTSLGDGIFANCTSLATVVIPDSVLNLGDNTNEAGYAYFWGVFQGCTNLTDVTIGTGVTTIGSSAFNGCTRLPSITIPNGVVNIGADAFARCASLTNIIIPNSVTNIGLSAFGSCFNLVVVTIGTNVITIGDDAFLDCTDLTSIALPNNVASIGNYAFLGCRHLTSAVIGGGVTNIGTGAFEANAQLPDPGAAPELPVPPLLQPPTILLPAVHERAEIPDDSTNVDSSVAAPASSLTNITVAQENPAYSSLKGVLFNKRQTILIQFPCGLVGDYAIPGTVTTIGPNAFLSATRLTSVAIPNSVTNVGSHPFVGCSGLRTIIVAAQNPAYSSANGVLFDKKRIILLECPEGRSGIYTIPKTIANVGNFAFEGCTNLTGVTLPETLTNIGGFSFAYCLKLARIVIPNSVKGIGSDAFIGCSRLAIVSIPDRVTSIGNYAFSGCSSLVHLAIPKDVTSIGDGTFENCADLASIIIPNGVTNIGQNAFSDCTGLTRVGIPGSVTSIGAAAFEDCSGLTSISIPGNVTDIGPYAFFGCTALTEVTIPNGANNIEYEAFAHCANLAGFSIPNTVTNIGFDAFWDCTNLAEAYFQGDAPAGNSYGTWFQSDTNVTVYYLPGTVGWGTNFSGAPSVMGNPTLTVQTNGIGTITPNDNGALLKLGAQYILTAMPGPGFKFLNWTGGSNEPLMALTNGPKLQFVMQLNQILQANFVETSRPIVTITSPALDRRVTNALAVVTGTASDDWQVAGVWCQLDNGPWQAAQSTNHWANWNVTASLTDGANTVKVYAVNLGGLCSLTNSVTIVSGNTFKLHLKLESVKPLAFTLETSSNLTGHLEYSTNLVNWVYWTNFSVAETTVSFHDLEATNAVQRFYRAVIP